MAKRKTPSKGSKPDKLIRDMLIFLLHEKEKDGSTKLRKVANKLISLAINGDLNSIKEISNRVDGKCISSIGLIDDQKTNYIIKWKN